jgi:hypothetical protein
MFTLDEFSQLEFLTGRWKGVSADGKEFFEEYDRPEPTVFHSRRYPDASFSTHSEGSTISFQDGEVVSQWHEFTWRAASIGPDRASFAPVNAPSEFNWLREDDATLVATQRLTVAGKLQQYTMRLEKMPPG